MALNGAYLIDKLKELRERYSDFRLNNFKKVYPQYQKSPKSVEPELRSELEYFLNELKEITEELEGSLSEVQSPDFYAAIKNAKTLLMWQENGNKLDDENLTENQLAQEDAEDIFTLDLNI